MIAITIFIGLFLVFSNPAGDAGPVPERAFQAPCQAKKSNKINSQKPRMQKDRLKKRQFDKK
jgi:hypothetical protein